MNKNPTIAAVLSFFFPGLGQLYNGHFGKACLVWAIPGGAFLLLAFLSMAGAGEAFAPVGMLIIVFCAIGAFVYSIADAYNSAMEMEVGAAFALAEHKRKSEVSITGVVEEERPPVPPGGFQRKVRGKPNFKPFDPID